VAVVALPVAMAVVAAEVAAVVDYLYRP
jgi:hypothetical protein